MEICLVDRRDLELASILAKAANESGLGNFQVGEFDLPLDRNLMVVTGVVTSSADSLSQFRSLCAHTQGLLSKSGASYSPESIHVAVKQAIADQIGGRVPVISRSSISSSNHPTSAPNFDFYT